MDFKSQKSISSLEAVFSKAWVLCSSLDWDSSHQNEVACSSRSWNKGGAITNVNQRGCRPRGAPVTGKQCLTNIIFGRPLQRQNSFRTRSFGEDHYAVTSFCSFGGLHTYHRHGAADTALMTTAQVLCLIWFLLLSPLLREEKTTAGSMYPPKYTLL